MTLNRVTVAIFIDAISFLVSGLTIATLPLPKGGALRRDNARKLNVFMLVEEIRDGWRFAFVNPTVRAVVTGMATGLLGGGMLVPLGGTFVETVLGSDEKGYGLVLFALGSGVAIGVAIVIVTQKRLSAEFVFPLSVLAAGCFLIAAIAMTSFRAAVVWVFCLGGAAGFVYVLGFTILHKSVDDELRGRIFSTLNVLVRLVVAVAVLAGPALASVLDGLSRRLWGDRRFSLGIDVFMPGVRLTLLLAGLIILAAGVLAVRSIRSGTESGRFRDVSRVPS
jgi:dTMP kinase